MIVLNDGCPYKDSDCQDCRPCVHLLSEKVETLKNRKGTKVYNIYYYGCDLGFKISVKHSNSSLLL